MNRTLDTARIVERHEVAAGNWLIDLSVELSDAVQPGQFAMVHPPRGGFLLPRPFSILDYHDAVLSLLVKEVGTGSRSLAHEPVGAEVGVFAPLGSGFPLEEFRGRKVVLVAGGVGLVPLWRLRHDLIAAGESEPLALFGARTPADLPLALLDGWRIRVEEDPSGAAVPSPAGGVEEPLVKLDGSVPVEFEGSVPVEFDNRVPVEFDNSVPVELDGSVPATVEKGLVTLGLEEIPGTLKGAAVALCGPDPMMKAAARIAVGQGAQVWVCLEEQMACGAGVCRSCAIPASGGASMKTVCKDGPVFRLDEIDYV